MGISINTNIAATRAGVYLGANHANLQKSLDRLSSGKRITEPADDAGGLAVSMKLEHTSKVLRGTSYNISNAISLLQVQDGVLKSAGDIVSRMGELKSMSMDVTKNSSDIDLYDAEFDDLQIQLYDMAQTKFNGIQVFDHDGSTAMYATDQENLSVVIAEDGTTTADAHQASLLGALSVRYLVKDNGGADTGTGATTNVLQSPETPDDLLWSGIDNSSTHADGLEAFIAYPGDALATPAIAASSWTAADGVQLTVGVQSTGTRLELQDLTQEGFTQILENIASLRATNGGQVRRLQYANANVETQITNISAANGRIMDVDIAAESANLARQQVLVQASAAMTAQANMSNDVALMLLQ
jgi:flagellin-like hook-associated protein FlgL